VDVSEIFGNYFASELTRGGSLSLMKSEYTLNEDSVEGLVKRANESDIHEILRSAFGKSGELASSRIGGHPDFDYLEDSGGTEESAIATMFMDIESSTRLGLLYDVHDVFRIKNTFIKMAIEVMRALDGHVHRIMGDAVMAFFGGRETDEDNLIDAINCASSLVHIVKRSVIPKLEELGYVDNDFGIRIGLDFGKEKTVLWGSYGIPNFNEVTATSFFVDIASKLQSQGGRNQVMLGQSIVEELDFPEKFLEIKKIRKNGELIDSPYVTPNISDRDGNKVNYKKYILKHESYLGNTAFPSESEAGATPLLPVVSNSFSIKIELYEDEHLTRKISDVLPGAVSINKGCWLKFIVQLNYNPMLPATFRFSVTNHGKEAWEAGKQDNGTSDYQNHSSEYIKKNYVAGEWVIHKEGAKYKGLHEMKLCVLNGNGKVLHSTSMVIFIK